MGRLRDFFWPSGDIDDYIKIACKRLLILFSTFAFLICAAVTTRYFVQRPGSIPLYAEFMLYSYFIFLLVPTALYKGLPIKLVAYLTVGYTFIRLGTVAFVMGGLASSQVLFFLPTVLILTFICGNKAGFVGTAIALAFFTFLEVSTQHIIDTQNLAILRTGTLASRVHY